MFRPAFTLACGGLLWALVGSPPTESAELIPPRNQLKADRPRLLLRPEATPHAISLGQLRDGPRDAEFQPLLKQLQQTPHAAAQALAWLMTGDWRALAHCIEVGDGTTPPDSGGLGTVRLTQSGLEATWGQHVFLFESQPPFRVLLHQP